MVAYVSRHLQYLVLFHLQNDGKTFYFKIHATTQSFLSPILHYTYTLTQDETDLNFAKDSREASRTVN